MDYSQRLVDTIAAASDLPLQSQRTADVAGARLPKVLVLQMGARHAYGLARMLHDRGALAGLYTDASWSDEASLLRRLLGALPGRYQAAVHRRTVRGLPAQKWNGSILPNLVGRVARVFGFDSPTSWGLEDRVLGWLAMRWGLKGANIVLNTMGNGGSAFLEWAKNRGASIATDVYITPLAAEIYEEEVKAWPGWETKSDSSAHVASFRLRVERLIKVSDLLLCPSQTVVDGLSAFPGFDKNKVAVVPYVFDTVVNAETRPQTKRILFAGEAGLRKGLPYLGIAATLLKKVDPAIEVYIAGRASEIIRSRPECRDLTFLGHLGQSAMFSELKKADVFCLPSLAEGSAGAVLEALAHGLPCVITPSTGTTITNGVEGIVVPERNPKAVAEAIWQIVSDRDMRARMSAAAVRLAQSHRHGQVGTVLYEALAKLAARTSSPA